MQNVNVHIVVEVTEKEHIKLDFHEHRVTGRQIKEAAKLPLDTELAVDRDTVQIFTASIIQEAAKVGNCVIIGRSAQCVLRRHPHVLRMLVYAPLSEKVARMKLRHPHEQNVQALLRRVDSERLHYARYYYDCDSADPRLYHITMNSTLGIDTCARMVAQIIQSS